MKKFRIARMLLPLVLGLWAGMAAGQEAALPPVPAVMVG
jgi:hypothetical protein